MMQSSFRTMLSLTTTKIVVNRTMIISTCNIRCLSSSLGNAAPVTAIAVTPITPPARRSVATALSSSLSSSSSSSSSSSTPLSIKIVSKRTIFSAAANAAAAANVAADASAAANAAAAGDSSTKPPLVPLPVVRVVTIEVMPGCYNEFHKWRTELDAIMTKLDLHGVKVEHFESKRTTNILDSTSTVDDDDDDDNYDKDKHRSVMFQSRSASVAVLLGDDIDNDNDDNDNNDHKIYDTIITTFPSKKELNRWEESEERTEWLNRGNGKLLQM